MGAITNTIAMKTSPSGRITYHLARGERNEIILTVSQHSTGDGVTGGYTERTSYYPHVWEWVAESLGYVRPPQDSQPNDVATSLLERLLSCGDVESITEDSVAFVFKSPGVMLSDDEMNLVQDILCGSDHGSG